MRYALYLLPDPDSPLWREASGFIGYDAASGCNLTQPALPGRSAEALRDATEDPRRYGFHMTLKAPFRLAEGQTEAGLRDALARFCAARVPLELGALKLEARVGRDGSGFVCLAPALPCPALFLLEQETVRAFEPYRAPLTQQEVARRRPETLTPRQRTLLDTFGYPFVLDEFRPHFSLTGLLNEPEAWRGLLGNTLFPKESLERCTPHGIGLFAQTHPEARFRLITLAPFSGCS
jgi:hypothetical protein